MYKQCQNIRIVVKNSHPGILAEANETRSHSDLSHFAHCIMGFIQFLDKHGGKRNQGTLAGNPIYIIHLSNVEQRQVVAEPCLFYDNAHQGYFYSHTIRPECSVNSMCANCKSAKNLFWLTPSPLTAYFSYTCTVLLFILVFYMCEMCKHEWKSRCTCNMYVCMYICMCINCNK